MMSSQETKTHLSSLMSSLTADEILFIEKASRNVTFFSCGYVFQEMGTEKIMDDDTTR